ncbi:MAG TPA: hypothetical protein VLA43_02940, partial [Longimicrobiales bacterium]|nr:hypothetical protein [Longimicrobiales bacterium]
MSRRAYSIPAFFALALATLASLPVAAQSARDAVLQHVEHYAAEYGAMAQEIWDLAEVGYQEHESSEILQARLREHGFKVTAGVAGIPTAFVAEWGSGGTVLGVLAEFDALPGITQSRAPERDPVADKGAGHACGHHLFGTGS